MKGNICMFYLKKKIEIAGSHRLDLDYESPCKNIHGHNWLITVYCKSEKLNENGMVVDFKIIEELIHNKLDHKNLNEVLGFNPTAENIAVWVVKTVPFCYKAKVIDEVIYEL